MEFLWSSPQLEIFNGHVSVHEYIWSMEPCHLILMDQTLIFALVLNLNAPSRTCLPNAFIEELFNVHVHVHSSLCTVLAVLAGDKSGNVVHLYERDCSVQVHKIHLM